MSKEVNEMKKAVEEQQHNDMLWCTLSNGNAVKFIMELE